MRVHRCGEGRILPQAGLPVEGELLRLLQGAPRPGEERGREESEEETEGGEGPSEGSGAGQEAVEALPNRLRPDQGDHLALDDAIRGAPRHRQADETQRSAQTTSWRMSAGKCQDESPTEKNGTPSARRTSGPWRTITISARGTLHMIA